ncbi:hypothetical protein [Caballeronia sp. ATUFL_M1_KS5A]|uniref:hypothetical protein n=1 Tax=Caballeronia sp. ATUFL_M1_KS5A TaxID=2921778 RepID=UPI0020298D5C|nr:hypothetical protein [Caballeronia sp. ATUFL_M1_KS5A]
MRDVTGIPDELLAVIARAIRLHVQSYCASIVARLDTLEKAEARDPVINVTSFPVKDHTEAIEGVRRSQEANERQAVEDRRAVDRLLGGMEGICERVKTLESHEAALSDTGSVLNDHTETIDFLRRAQETQEQRAAEDRRALDRLVSSFDSISERFKTLESRQPVVIPANPPVKDHTEAIDSLRCAQESHHRQAIEDRRALDRLLATFDSIRERFRTLESREPVVIPANAPVKDHTETIESLRRECEQHAQGAAEDRRALDRLRNSFDALGERVKTLETREIPIPKDGEPGRDAFELDVLPGIDFSRDYSRGTLAQHQGGLWRAHANTRGEHGWSCVVDGIASTHVAMDSERSFTVHIERANGAHETATFALPVMIYRGVYQAGETYQCGDMVTWAGSLWHCNATTDTKPDAGGDAWTLAAKRGRDGKDARMSFVGGNAA